MYTRFEAASFIMAEECNLNCDYCYEKGKHAAKFMTFDLAKKGIDFLIQGAKYNKKDSIYVAFFGGEPLLNFPVIDATFDYAIARTKEEGLRFDCKIITNCTLWPEGYEDFIRKWNTATNGNVFIQLSVDGMPEVQDLHRKTAGGGKSSPLVEETIQKYIAIAKELKLSLERQVSLHSVLTKESLPYLYDNYLYFRSIGFPGFACMPVIEEKWTDEDVKLFEEQYSKISDKIIEDCKNEKTDLYFQASGVLKDCRVAHSDQPCGAGNRFCTLTPDGNLYPCHRFYFYNMEKNNKFLLGNLDTDYKELDDKRDIFLQLEFKHMLGKQNCENCQNKNCRVCWAVNYEQNNNLAFTPPDYCKIVDVERIISTRTQNRMRELGFNVSESNGCSCGNNGDTNKIHQDIAELNQALKDVLVPLNSFITTVEAETKDNKDKLESLSERVDVIMEVMTSLVDMLQKLIIK